MKLDTWLTRELGIRYPVVQGAMHGLAGAELAAAVSEAGGLGTIAAGAYADAEALRQEIRRAGELTANPFAVNFTLMPARRPIPWEEYIATALEEGVGIIETSGRSPEPYIEIIRSAKVRHLHKVARIRDALTAQRLGADAVVIVGTEAGGHPGMEGVSTLVLVSRAVAELKIPVIAGGGFADGRGLAAALALGAQGIIMGTRFMASHECPLHPDIKELLVRTGEAGTMLVECSFNNAARVVRTPFAERVLALEEAGATIDRLFPLLDGQRVRKAYRTGATDDSLIYCGQSAGLIHEVLSVKEIIERTVQLPA